MTISQAIGKTRVCLGGSILARRSYGSRVVFARLAEDTSPTRVATLLIECGYRRVSDVLGETPKTTRGTRILPVLLFFLLATRVFAGTNQTYPTEDRSGIQIKINQCFNAQPRSGYAPICVTISNDTKAAHTWDFSFQSPGNAFGNNNGNSIHFQKSFSVAAQGERSFDVLVPLATIKPGQYVNSNVTIQASGYAVSAPSINLANNITNRSGGGASIGYSMDIESKAGNELRKKMDTGGSSGDVFACSITFKEPPADWRALSGFDILWITEKEWTALPPTTRLVIEQWVATGGILYLPNNDIRQGADNPKKLGYGEIKDYLPPANSEAFADFIFSEGKKNTTDIASQLTNSYRSNWPNKTIIPPYAPNSVLLITIIVLFGILVGPVNFFLLANKEKRHRIFWTTPALSIGGALLVGLTILIQDGFNGWGRRVAFIHLLPEQNSEVILQEQASRTALLTGSDFATDPTALLQPISLNDQPQKFATDGKNYSGDYFKSRRIQGQWLAAVRPSRAKVQLLNPSETATGQPPKILSSIAANLDELWLVSEKMDYWHAANVGPGQTITLTKINSLYQPDLLEKLAGPRLKTLHQRVATQPNYFYATARAPKDALLPTLSSIQWRDDRVLYLGPVSQP